VALTVTAPPAVTVPLDAALTSVSLPMNALVVSLRFVSDTAAPSASGAPVFTCPLTLVTLRLCWAVTLIALSALTVAVSRM
jgi:hypothetical protein